MMTYFKNIFLLLLTFVSIQVVGQSDFKNNEFINNNIKLLSSMILKGGLKSELNEAQIVQLQPIFAKKEIRWNKEVISGRDKGDLVEKMAMIDKEFIPQIESILSKEQKVAYRKANQQILIK